MITGTHLEPILASVRERARERRRRRSTADLRAEVAPDPSRRQRFVSALREPGLAIIAECKRSSPSAGILALETDLAARAEAYARGGAAALSVLTEEDHFQGAPADLERVAAAGLPRLRKDFLLEEGMVLESMEMGADAVLLLAVCLPGGLLAELRALAGELGLAVLLEVHDEEELERAMAVGPDCLGVNARNLATFQVELGTVEALLPRIGGDCVRIAESGIRGPAQLRRVRACGADATLVGEALMRSPHPEILLREWRRALA
ncbi:MAG: indole-3-glycerol-phosphate synthase [Planctomycetota bacterium]